LSRRLLAPAVAEFDQPVESIVTPGDVADPPPPIDDGGDWSASGGAADPADDEDTLIAPVATTTATGVYVKSNVQALTPASFEVSVGGVRIVQARGPPASRPHRTVASDEIAGAIRAGRANPQPDGPETHPISPRFDSVGGRTFPPLLPLEHAPFNRGPPCSPITTEIPKHTPWPRARPMGTAAAPSPTAIASRRGPRRHEVDHEDVATSGQADSGLDPSGTRSRQRSAVTLQDGGVPGDRHRSHPFRRSCEIRESVVNGVDDGVDSSE